MVRKPWRTPRVYGSTALALILLYATAISAQQPVTTEVILAGFRSLYSPSVLTFQGVKRLWLGGWLTDDDPSQFLASGGCGDDLSGVVGADKIFYSELVSGIWTWPVLVFAKVGFHVNDPSVIQPPSSDGIDRSQWLYMYYTALNNNDARCGRFDRYHMVGFASSTDGGKTWTDHGIVIDKAEGGDGFGAWSPSAVVVGNEIWIYYHTGTPDFSQPINFRIRCNLTGWQKLSGPERLTFAVPQGSPVLVSNLDITYQGSQFVMLANTTDLHNIVRYVSQDGMVWVQHPQDVNPIIGGGPNAVLTPHAETVSTDRYRTYFGFDTGTGSNSLHAWEFVAPPQAVNSAQFISQSVPSSLSVGQTASVSVTMQNIGTTTWTPASQYRLGSQNPQDTLTWGIGRMDLAPSDAIIPGQSKSFALTVTAPPSPGVYNFQWRMVQEGVEWFGALTPNAVVTVTTSSQPTLSLSATPTTITPGQSSTLSWSSTHTTSCTASGGWSGTKATSGSEAVSPAVTMRYTLNCSGATGDVTQSTTVTVTPRGDLDGNGKLTLTDVRWLIEMLAGTRPKDLTTADLTSDGKLTLADLQALIRLLVGMPCAKKLATSSALSHNQISVSYIPGLLFPI